MTWEAVAAIATAISALVIAATVFVGIRQVRLTRDTLEQLRRATQLEGAMQIFADLNTPEFRESHYFIRNDLKVRMRSDPVFFETVKRVGIADSKVHQELLVMRTFERIGAYVRNGLIDGAIIYDVALPVIVSCWEELADVIRIHREAAGIGLWENFEYLYHEGKKWMQRERTEAHFHRVALHQEDEVFSGPP